MKKVIYGTATLATIVLTVGLALPSNAKSKTEKCDLTVKGTGRHSCQCETLLDHKAKWQILMHLSSMNVCDSPTIGGGGGGTNPGTPQPKTPVFVDDDCIGDPGGTIECPT